MSNKRNGKSNKIHSCTKHNALFGNLLFQNCQFYEVYRATPKNYYHFQYRDAYKHFLLQLWKILKSYFWNSTSNNVNYNDDHSCTLCRPPVIFVDKSFVDSSLALSIDDIRVVTSHQRSKKLTKTDLDFYRLKEVQTEENRVNSRQFFSTKLFFLLTLCYFRC